MARAAADHHGLRRFSDVSTVAVAGHRRSETVTEDATIDWDRSDYDPYARTKKFCEHMVHELLPDVHRVVFRQAMGRIASGVSVVTTVAAGHDHAMTADTVTSVSLEPLLVLCADCQTPSCVGLSWCDTPAEAQWAQAVSPGRHDPGLGNAPE